jgi:hypothetical protein
MSTYNLASLALAFLGSVLCIVGVRRLHEKRVLSAIKFELTGIIFLLFAGIAFLLASNLYLYQRLVYETPIAEIEFVQTSAQSYTATLEHDGRSQQFFMRGDEWQLDAQMLIWHGYANLLGLDAQYRLHRLSGRYTAITDEEEKARSVHALGETADIDLWSLANQHQNLIGWLLDTSYGSAVYLPMSAGARYQISISRTGLVARPINAAAKLAVSRWIGL